VPASGVRLGCDRIEAQLDVGARQHELLAVARLPFDHHEGVEVGGLAVVDAGGGTAHLRAGQVADLEGVAHAADLAAVGVARRRAADLAIGDPQGDGVALDHRHAVHQDPLTAGDTVTVGFRAVAVPGSPHPVSSPASTPARTTASTASSRATIRTLIPNLRSPAASSGRTPRRRPAGFTRPSGRR
jgi:hypothetical protein